MRGFGQRLVPRSLRIRIMLALVGLVVALSASALLWASNDMTNLLEEELEQRGVAIARDVAARSTESVLTNDVIALYEVVNDTLLNNPDIRYLFLVDPSGDVRVHSFQDGPPAMLLSANSTAGGADHQVRVLRTNEGPVIDIAAPVFAGQGGTIRVGMSEAGLRQEVLDRVSRLGLLAAVASVAALVVSFFLSSLLTRPVVRLADAVRGVGRGELGRKVSVETSDELGTLAREFNAMTDAIAESRDDLIQRNEELRTLNAMAEHLSRQAAGHELPETSLQKLLELMELPAGWICLRDEHGNLSLAAYCGINPGDSQQAAIREDRCECRQVLDGGQAIVLTGAPVCPLVSGPSLATLDGQPLAVLPLFSGQDIIGILVVIAEQEFRSSQLALLTSVGQQIGIALENARLYREVQSKDEIKGHLLDKLIVAQEEERMRIARELHDEPSQALSGILMRLDQLQHRLPAAQRSQRQDMEVAIESVRDTMGSLHRIMLELRPVALDDLGLVPAIRSYAEQRLQDAGIELDFQATSELARTDPQVEIAVFRLTQEAVNNIYKHSGARHALLSLELRGSILHGVVEDDGRGFDIRILRRDVQRTQALGLAGMEERARLLGGKFDITSLEGHGTKIVFDVPLYQGVTSDVRQT